MSLFLTAAFALTSAAQPTTETHLPNRSEYVAPQATVAPVVDGIANDAIWQSAEWRSIDQIWLGEAQSADDFSGRFKVVWTPAGIYILAEIVDDILYDSHRHPLQQYWDDDCLEIFIDEDYSGGDHQYNHNAFAYHIALDNQVVDIGIDQQARLYNDHITSQWRADGNKVVWEIAIKVFADDYIDDSDANQPVELQAGKIIGLMLAWCDNDGNDIRENFIGSEAVATGATDRGWIDAGLFGKVVLEGN